MKIIVKAILEKINFLQLLLISKNISLSGNKFFKTSVTIANKNKADFNQSKIENTKIFIDGENNEFYSTSALISRCIINISGQNNRIFLEKEVKLRGADINIRGNNCTLNIGKGSSFGGIRIINVGENNAISIGENCLFADKIELWASDTHCILNEKNEILNKEKPIFIGDRVWVGSCSIILKGVTINDDSIIGMGTIVTKDVPKKTISVGSPNRIIKENVTWKLDY